MGMCNQDVSDRLAFQAGLQRFDMLVQQRAGIYDSNVTAADDIGASTAKRKAARIARSDSANQRRKLLQLGVFVRVLIDKGYFGGHSLGHCGVRVY